MARKPILIAFALLLLPLVFALSENFAAGAPSEIPVFFCAPATSQFTVSNTGSVASVYSILLGGDASLYSSVDYPQFSLEPGQTATLTTSLNVPCDLRGSDELVTVIRTSFGLEKSFSQDVVVYTPDNIEASMTPEELTIGPCEVATFDITLENRVNYEETYDLRLLGIDIGTLSEDRITLAAGKSKDVTLRAEPLDCTMHGQFPFSVEIVTQKSQIQESLVGAITVEPNFIPQVALDRVSYTNYYEEQWVPVHIENIGDVAAIYDVAVTGASFASAQPQNIRVEGKSTETINVKLLPFNDSSPGDYEVAVKLTVVPTGNVYQAAPFTLTLKEHNAFTWFYVNNTWLFWGIVVGLIVLIVLAILLVVYLSLPSTKERRAKKKAERLARKEEKKKAKALKKEVKRKAKEAKKAAKAKKKAELAKAKAETKAAKEKARREEQKARAAEEKAQEKAKADARRVAAKDKRDMIRAVKKEYFLINKEDEGFRPLPLWKKLVVGLVLVLAIMAIAVGLWIFWTVLSPFLIAMLIGVIVLLIIVLVLLWWRYHSIGYFTRREIKLREREQAMKEKLAAERKAQQEALKAEREKLAEQRRAEKEKAKADKLKAQEQAKAAKEASAKEKAAQQKKPRSWKWLGWLSTLALLVLIVVLGAVFWAFVVAFWPAVITGVVLAAVIALLITTYAKNHIRRSWPFAKGWVFVRTNWRVGLGEVRFKLDKIGEDVRVKVNKARGTDIFVVPGAKIYQYFNFDVYADFASLKAAFRVKNRFMRKYDVKLMQFVRGAWEEVKTKLVSDDRRYSYFQAALDKPGQFAIVGHRKEVQRKWWPWFIVLAILLIALLFTFGLVGQTATPDFNGIPPQTWFGDTVHVVDLTQFFQDPDGDVLRFSATPIEDINVFIDSDGNAVLTPASGFVGERSVIFTATDSRGGTVSSNRVALLVRQSPVPVEYLPWIKWGLIGVLLFVLLIVLVRFRKTLLEFISE